MITQWIAEHHAWVGVFIGFPLGMLASALIFGLCGAAARGSETTPDCRCCPMLACLEESEIVEASSALPAISPGSSGGHNRRWTGLKVLLETGKP